MTTILVFLRSALDFVLAMIPRFTTDWVGCLEDDDGVTYPEYPMQIWDIEHDGIPDAVCRIRSFQLLGWSVLGRIVGEPMTYEEWCRHISDQETGDDH